MQSVDQDVVDLVDEFLTRIRTGEPATIDEYIARRPDLSEQISAYLPLVAMLESNGALRPSTDDIPGDTTRPISVATTLTEGSQFGRYDILELLGKGAMGTVFLAHDTELHRKVALKVPHLTDGRSAKRFAREARALAAIEHPHLCPIYDVGEVESIPYFTMALIEGKTLAEILRDSETLSEQEAAELMRKVALAVHAAHESGIVHRDLKPSNIILRRAETDLTAAPPTDEVFATLEPVVMDFGLASLSREGDAKLTHDGAIVGSPAYMSPEQIESDSDRIGPPADVYALGVVLFEILSGQRPFEGKLLAVLRDVTWEAAPDLSTVRSDVAPELAAICQKAMAKQPEDRYASAAALAGALDQFLQTRATDGTAVSAEPGAAPSPHSNRRRRLIAVALCLLAVGGPLAFALTRGRTSDGSNQRMVNQVQRTGQGAAANVREVVSIQQPPSAKNGLDGRPSGGTEKAIQSRQGAGSVEKLGEFFEVGQSIGEGIRAVSLGDLDNDGDLDAFLAMYRWKLRVMLNDGKGRFSSGPSVPDPDQWRNWEVELGDVDADGDLDAFVTKMGRDRLWLNDGHASFTDSGQDFGVGDSNRARFGDLDGDGNPDLFVTQKRRCRIWFNRGSGQFEDSGQLLGQDDHSDCDLGDIDGDGDLDVFVVARNAPHRVWVNDGQGVFSDSGQRLGEAMSVGVQLCDYDGDGDLDAFVANRTVPAEVWRNDGHGEFSLAQHGAPSDDVSSILVIDIDGDSDLDVFQQSTHQAPEVLWINDGQSVFAKQVQLPPAQIGRFDAGDLDGDGDIDIFADRIWINQLGE